MPLAVRSPVSDAAREVGSGCQESGHLPFDLAFGHIST
jgi:hypothetical protein